jgi:hypothetical protein
MWHKKNSIVNNHNPNGYDIKEYIEQMINYNYYIILIIEDLINYYGFVISSDSVSHDIRTILMKNNIRYETVTIKSIIVSHLDENFTQYNEIIYKNKMNNELNYKYFGNCHKKKYVA